MKKEGFLKLENVNKRYLMGNQVVAALNDVNLQIDRGEFVSITGPSGSGKSTILQILGTLDLPTDGRFLLEDRDTSDLSDTLLSALRNKYFGFVFQNFNLLPDLTAVENVELPLQYTRLHPRTQRQQALTQLEKVGLLDRADHHPSQLSGGQQQRVAIARALVNNPIVILADEPTGNLPQDKGQEILGILKDLHQKGVTVIIVTHDPLVAATAQREIRIVDGRVVQPQKPETRVRL